MRHKIAIIVQARMASTRMYGKVLAPLLGQPVLLHLLARLARVQTPHDLIVACPDTPEDALIHALCARHGYRCMRVSGDQNDVLGRFYTAVETLHAEEIVRVCGDTPLVDPGVIDALVAYRRRNEAHHTGLAPAWGDGFDAEVFVHEVLAEAHTQATLPHQREHVSPYIFEHPDRFCCTLLPCAFDMSWMRLSVDAPQDLADVEQILVRALQSGYGYDIGWQTLALLCHDPDIRSAMARRPMNRAYGEQVAREQGTPVQSWEALRYGIR